MRYILIFWLMAAQTVAAQPAAARQKVSPWIARHPGFAYVVQFAPRTDMDRARALAVASGFKLLRHPDLLPNDLLVAGPAERLERLAAAEEVRHILPASADLVLRRRLMPCAGGIAGNGAVADYVTVGGWAPDASGAVTLQYFFQSLTSNLDASTAESQIERAFSTWQQYGNFTLSPGGSASSDRTLKILFASGAHGDDYPFTSTSLLAHTFYPPPLNTEPTAGNMHFNAAEDWQVGGGMDLYSVALHETGHALGLAHTDDPDAVMYPYYHTVTGLTADDIAGIQDLYGAADTGVADGGGGSSGSGSTGSGSTGTGSTGTTGSTGSTGSTGGSGSSGGGSGGSQPAPAPGAPPTLQIIVPGTSIVSTSSATLTVSGTASSGAGLTVVTWTTSNGDTGVATGTASWTASVPLLVGDNAIVVRAYDAGGNSAWRSLDAVRQ